MSVPENFQMIMSAALFGGEEIRVNGSVALPLLRQVFESENGGHRANRDARAAIDAFHWVDIKLRYAFEAGFIFARVNAIHRANVHARGILGAGAGFGDYVSHSKSPLKRNTGEQRGRLINRNMQL
jgi:hypothetical protein